MFKFTVITPTLNSENGILRCIKSVVDEYYENYEHIIIDGGSTDKTIKIRINGTTGNGGNGWQSDMAIDDFGIDDHVSMEEESELNNSISIYPNPSTGEFNISINNPSISNANLEVFDVYGRLVYSKNVSSKMNSINLSEFSSGVYTVKISANSQVSIKRIIKN